MSVNQRLIGRQEQFSFLVGREHIRDFANAIGDPNPLYHDVQVAYEVGHPDLLAPPTFLIVLNFRPGSILADPGLGVDTERIMQRGQNFSHHRAVHAGDTLNVTQTFSEIRSIGSRELMLLVSEVTMPDGDPVARLETELIYSEADL